MSLLAVAAWLSSALSSASLLAIPADPHQRDRPRAEGEHASYARCARRAMLTLIPE